MVRPLGHPGDILGPSVGPELVKGPRGGVLGRLTFTAPSCLPQSHTGRGFQPQRQCDLRLEYGVFLVCVCGHDVWYVLFMHVVYSLSMQYTVLACGVSSSCVVWSVVALVSDGEAELCALGLQVPSPHPSPRLFPQLARASGWVAGPGDTWVLGAETPAQRPLATDTCA